MHGVHVGDVAFRLACLALADADLVLGGHDAAMADRHRMERRTLFAADADADRTSGVAIARPNPLML